MRNRFIKALTLAVAVTLAMEPMAAVAAPVATESTVTQEMCDASYWVSNYKGDVDALLMTKEQIASYNATALKTKDCSMYDLTAMDASYDATKIRDNLAQSIKEAAPSKDTYANHTKIDQTAYYQLLADWTAASGWTGICCPKYALGVEQTQIKSVPTRDFIGYSETDSDDEIVLGALRVNEPFLVKQMANINGSIFYYGYSNNVCGWVLGDDLAFCGTKSDWLKSWQTTLDGTDFVVVTDDYFSLSQSEYTKSVSGLQLTMGTVLKLVPQSEIPRSISMRTNWNSYVVYVPTRGENGQCVQEIALIAQNKDVSVGYIPVTARNLIEQSFKYLGDTYGWGGMLDSVDCSALVRNVYKCCGLEMPRNTTWQKCIAGTAVDTSNMDSASKASGISQCIPGTALYMPGHTMIYLGTVDGVNYVISAVGSTVDSEGYIDVRQINSVTITPLTVRRRNGSTWLDNIDTAVMPWNI